MWLTGKEWYFAVGESGLKSIKMGVALSWLQNVTSILDLPCGHGRVARYLRAAYPEAKMFFCDLEKSGVDFCTQHFGGKAVYSQPELTEVALPTVDLIWVGSLFTHIDLDRTKRWLAYLARHLSPQGVLVATFHGHWTRKYHEEILPIIDAGSWDLIMKSYGETGFGYAPYGTPGMMDYGISLTRPGVVCDIISGIPGVRLIGYTERGWADNHDVVAITKNDRFQNWATLAK